MIATQNTQSLSDFRQKAADTLERLNKTGEAEIITVNGQARAVLLSPAVYDQMMRDANISHDVTVVRKAMKQIDDGQGLDVDDAMTPLRKELLAMKKTGKSTVKRSSRSRRKAGSR